MENSGPAMGTAYITARRIVVQRRERHTSQRGGQRARADHVQESGGLGAHPELCVGRWERQAGWGNRSLTVVFLVCIMHLELYSRGDLGCGQALSTSRICFDFDLVEIIVVTV